MFKTRSSELVSNNEVSLFGAPFMTPTPEAQPQQVAALEPQRVRLQRMLVAPSGAVPSARILATSIDETTAKIMVDRVGRIAFGLVLIVGFAALVGNAIRAGVDDSREHAAVVLGGAWALAIGAWLVARAVARRAVRRRSIARWPSLGTSTAIPAAGIMLALPLLIHMPIAIGLGGLRGFDEWVTLSLVCVGIAHLFGAGFAAYRSYRFARGNEKPTKETLLMYTMIAAAVPGALLLLIPVLVVAATGAFCVIALAQLDVIALREREALGEC